MKMPDFPNPGNAVDSDFTTSSFTHKGSTETADSVPVASSFGAEKIDDDAESHEVLLKIAEVFLSSPSVSPPPSPPQSITFDTSPAQTSVDVLGAIDARNPFAKNTESETGASTLGAEFAEEVAVVTPPVSSTRPPRPLVTETAGLATSGVTAASAREGERTTVSLPAYDVVIAHETTPPPEGTGVGERKNNDTRLSVGDDVGVSPDDVVLPEAELPQRSEGNPEQGQLSTNEVAGDIIHGEVLRGCQIWENAGIPGLLHSAQQLLAVHV